MKPPFVCRFAVLCGLLHAASAQKRTGTPPNCYKLLQLHRNFYLFCGVLIEYFGVHGDPEYDKRTEHKLEVYARNGLSVIPVYPDDLNNRWEDWLLARVDESLERKLSASRIAVVQHQERHRR